MFEVTFPKRAVAGFAMAMLLAGPLASQTAYTEMASLDIDRSLGNSVEPLFSPGPLLAMSSSDAQEALETFVARDPMMTIVSAVQALGVSTYEENGDAYHLDLAGLNIAALSLNGYDTADLEARYNAEYVRFLSAN